MAEFNEYLENNVPADDVAAVTANVAAINTHATLRQTLLETLNGIRDGSDYEEE